MNTFPSSNSLSVSVHVYRALLVAYPKKFREHYETQMIQVFRDSFRYEYHRNGIFGVIDLWLHTFADLLVTALIERLMAGSRYMFSPKVILWGSVASVFAGLFYIMSGLAPLSAGAPGGLALVLGLGGLVGLYSRQAGQGGRLGLAGFILGIIGTVLVLAIHWWGFTSSRFSSATIVADPTLLAPPMLILSLGLIILGIGIVLLGVTSLRGKALHRWRGLPLGLGLLNILGGMAFWLVYYLPLSQGRDPWDWRLIGGHVVHPAVYVTVSLGVLLGLGWMGLGIMLSIEANAKVAEPPPASA